MKLQDQEAQDWYDYVEKMTPSVVFYCRRSPSSQREKAVLIWHAALLCVMENTQGCWADTAVEEGNCRCLNDSLPTVFKVDMTCKKAHLQHGALL